MSSVPRAFPSPSPKVVPASARMIIEVVAQIKSSVAVTSLNDVVSELVKNSLDANAAKIEVTVDYARGGCVVEDDGLGINAQEFQEEGGLGKLHREQHNISGSHGTRVSVRDLFGNMPVRVKQRTAVLELGPEDDKLWENLRRTITGLLLAWKSPTSIVVKDARKDRRIRVVREIPGQRLGTTTKQNSNLNLHDIVSILSQAGYISPEVWSAWVPISGSTSSISIKGAISTRPAPSKQAQYIAIGVEPLTPHLGHSELYEHINKVFSNSQFGTVERDADIDEAQRVRRRKDKRSKNDGHTNSQLKGRKGIDRWPMFFLQILFRSRSPDSPIPTSDLLAKEANVQAVIEVLNVMLFEWLTAHRFRPRKPGVRGYTNDTLRYLPSKSTRSSPIRASQSPLAIDDTVAESTEAMTTLKQADISCVGSSKSRSIVPGIDPVTPSRHFSDWSRIKSGKPDFYEKAWGRGQVATSEPAPTRRNDGSCSLLLGGRTLSLCTETASLVRPDRLQESLSIPRGASPLSDKQGPSPVSRVGGTSDERAEDGNISWIDPSTKETVLVNARTGVVAGPVPRYSEPESVGYKSQSDGTTPWQERGTNGLRRLSRRAQALSPNRSKSTSWFTEFLSDWDNPVYRNAEERIPQALPQEVNRQAAGSGTHEDHLHLTNVVRQASQGFPVFSTTRIWRDALCNAEVLAQVDKKFILVKMLAASPSSEVAGFESDSQKEILVLIDQHAADERCIVESLLQDLCTPSSQASALTEQDVKSTVKTMTLDPPIRFEVPESEKTQFYQYIEHFARWGILYEITDDGRSLHGGLPVSQPASRSSSYIEIITRALPPVIAERCRLEPKHIINLMRSEIWTDGKPASARDDETLSTTDSHAWLQRIGNCPRGILDLINSRACRSAVMFNDRLSLVDCRALVKRLADCAFPFQCAHGRPSMVPLVNLEDGKQWTMELNSDLHRQESGVRVGDGSCNRKSCDDFGEAWKEWRRKMRPDQPDGQQ
ncbi:MAG: hypothetical protein Q9165_000744 [Trypethelium subeluteriae]